MGGHDPLVSPHPAYLARGRTLAERTAAYRRFVDEGCQAIEIDSIRAMTSLHRAIGTEDFKRCLEEASGRPMGFARMGRPPGGVET
jgi:putative transposase